MRHMQRRRPAEPSHRDLPIGGFLPQVCVVGDLTRLSGCVVNQTDNVEKQWPLTFLFDCAVTEVEKGKQRRRSEVLWHGLDAQVLLENEVLTPLKRGACQ